MGIVGYPNVGKSSLLTALSRARPEIADYPFTTLEPQLGVVDAGSGNQFILAEIPGLIEGAHSGRGLGHSFLKHAMRTRVLLHLLDGGSAEPLEDMFKVNNELAMFDTTLSSRPQVVAVNKIDLPAVQERRRMLEKSFAEAGVKPVFISAATGEGLSDLVKTIWQTLKERAVSEQLEPAGEKPPQVHRPKPQLRGIKAYRRGNTYILSDPGIERLLDRLDLETPEDLEEFNQALEKMGVNKTLKEAGAKSGDTVKIGDMEWTWFDDTRK